MLHMNSKKETTNTVPDTVAEENSSKAQQAVSEAIADLGQKYYEANKSNASAEFYGKISEITKLIGTQKLWYQYTLSLDGKMQCEKCGAIITSDSLFCNKCGNGIEPLDFSSLGIETDTTAASPDEKVCPSCGRKLNIEAKFCDKCGFDLS